MMSKTMRMLTYQYCIYIPILELSITCKLIIIVALSTLFTLTSYRNVSYYVQA